MPKNCLYLENVQKKYQKIIKLCKNEGLIKLTKNLNIILIKQALIITI